MKSPVVIIGAPRSGTNMLRDVLVKLPGFGTWPCDEINYIWRHGNATYPSDEFPPELARPEVASYIRDKFKSMRAKLGVEFLVEKTCANSLRMDFVDRILPEAKYIIISRSGLDAVSSSIKRWKAPVDWSYLSKKARFVPFTDLPYYAARYLGSRIYKLISREKSLSFWGPRFVGMNEMTGQCSGAEVAAMQWRRCVEKTGVVKAKLPDTRVIEIRYEDFVQNPVNSLGLICSFLDVQYTQEELAAAVVGVRQGSVGLGLKDLDQSVVQQINAMLSE